ncbi:MAG TPA: PilZ domain-containing protein [Polyangia bacterium]|nr:PilZ domain-containing protein [Polyangia bacterium]
MSPRPPDPAAPRRQHERRDLRMSAEIRTARATFTATTRDLSEGGAGLNCDRLVVEGEEVTLGLFLVLDDVETDTPPLWVKGHVAWVRPSQDQRCAAGVRFEVITDEQRKWLRQVLTEIGPGEPSVPVSV